MNTSTNLVHQTNRKKYLVALSAAALTASIAGIGTAAAVNAATSDAAVTDQAVTTQSAPMFNVDMEQKHQAELDAIKNNDYDAWVKAHASEDQFNELVKIYQDQGEAGLQAMHPSFAKAMAGKHGGPNHEAQQYVQSGDYDQWKAAMTTELQSHAVDQAQIETLTSQDTFTKLQEADKLMQSGDRAGARAIMDQLRPAGMGPRLDRAADAGSTTDVTE